MVSEESKNAEEYVFEFYDEDYAESLEDEIPEKEEEYNEIDFESDLNEEQLKVVNNISGPMLVIAGAGSGKTRTIVYSVAKLLLLGVKPSQIMLVTFTNKAANEMIKRVESLLGKRPKGIWAGTFHSIANRFLRMYAKTMGLKPNYIIMDETDSKGLMKLAIEQAKVKEDLEERFPTAAMCKDILSYSINCNKKIREVIQWKYNQFDSEPVILKLQEVYNIYRKKKADDNLVDFDDLLVFWNKLLDERFVAKLVAKRIKYILVDEYQDTNYIQDQIIYKIAQENPGHNVMAVGDDAQSIYAFRGANYENILKFEKRYKNCKRYTITYNYRSIPQILELANNSIKHNKKQYQKKMKATRQNSIKPYQVNVGDDWDQSRFIANQILKLRTDGYELNEMAILIRAGSHSMRVEMELKAKNIPYEVRAGVAFFEKAHIKDMLAHLKVIENQYDEISWMRIFSIIPGIGTKSAVKLFKAISKTTNPIQNLSSKLFIEESLKGSKISKVGIKNLISHIKNLLSFSPDDNSDEVIMNLTPILENYLKAKFENWQDRMDDLIQLSIYAKNFPTVRKFIENLSLNYSNLESKTVIAGNQQIDEKPLILSTIHRAKGLEWRIVFIPMLCENFFPSSRVIGDPEAIEEERRVFYVAITRAKDELYLISPSIIQTFRESQLVNISQFISELNEKVYQKSSVDFKSKKKKVKEAIFKSAYDLVENDS
ncbi:MAG: ATP-dependent helicase [Candidatus Hermodarchaeota archaeon]